MRQKLFYLACAFVFMWTLGEVFEAPHRQNVIQAISMTIAYAIYLGLHSAVWNQIKTLSSKKAK
jgi:uncharacterized membrane protein YjjB (DUF3815 family)